ncbi:MAG: hypothetical protein H0V66_15770 [Bdellovibrionales bacterium]|nr:hypothetical protein [Bdellovibrionales bacterium]
MKSNNILALVALLSLAACGGGGGSGGSGKENPQRELIEATPGTYYTVLRPVNIQSNGFIPYGAATFTLKDDQLQVSVSMDDDQAVNHRQTLHLGSRCPTAADDTNGDNFIDYNEAMAVVSEVLMPLDADLNSQAAGSEIYPRGRSMTYSKSALLSNINADLMQTMGKKIGFIGRVILIHGTSANSVFPSSLASHNNEPAHLSLPVVCGVLEKIE